MEAVFLLESHLTEQQAKAGTLGLLSSEPPIHALTPTQSAELDLHVLTWLDELFCGASACPCTAAMLQDASGQVVLSDGAGTVIVSLNYVLPPSCCLPD